MCRAPGHLLYRRPPTSVSLPSPTPHPHPPHPWRQLPADTFPLPLKAVSVEAKVADFCASVTVRQTFVNAESTPIEAIYQFQLQEKATVSDFEALIDGNKIKGTIQEKEAAKDTYDDAIASGHGAYLMEEKEDEPNVFTVNVGNLPPGKSVDISITYVTELEFEEGQLKFRLPSNNDNPSYSAASASNSAPHLKLRVDFDMTSNIRSLSSPSHPITFEFGEEPTQATVTLAGDSAQAQAAKDLIVLTKLAKPHQPCGRVEANEKDGARKTVMVSLFPQLELADDEDVYTEMIFIVDRSGSMSGSRINQVKDTLQIFLRSLGEGTMFNIIGFGSRTQHLFGQGSVEYNDKNLEIATDHVKNLSANLGGTNILKPLQEVLRVKTKEGYPRQLFILTDGEVGNTQECVEFVRKHAETTRVFTFGVGNEASQDLVKGLAKAGEGFFEFVRSGEAMEEKVMRQLRRAMQPALTDITVTWKGAAADLIQPAPFRLPPLFCGGRLVVYGIVDGSSGEGEEVEVVVQAKTAVKPFECAVKVDLSKATKGTLLNKLAARTLLKDLEDGRSYLHDGEGAVKAGKDVVGEMVRVSLASGVLCKHTAFVAVEERDDATEGTMKVRKIPVTFEKLSQQRVTIPNSPYLHSLPMSTGSGGGGGRGRGRGAVGGRGGRGGPMSYHPSPPPSAPMSYQAQPQLSLKDGKGKAADKEKCKRNIARAMPEMASLSASSSVPFARSSRSRSSARDEAEDDEDEVREEKKSGPPPEQMRDIIMKQKASGSWDWNDAMRFVGLTSDKLRSGIPSAKLQTVDKEVELLWATAVVAAFLQKHFPEQKTNWDLVVKKALKFVARQNKTNVKLAAAAAVGDEIDWLQVATAFLP